MSRLRAPLLALAGCVQADLWRDTTVAPALSDSQCRSYFPTTPFAGLSGTLEGEGWQVLEDGRPQPMPARCLIARPRARPTLFRCQGGTRSCMSALHADALQALTGLDIVQLVDRFVPVDELLGPDWQSLNARMLAAADETECQQRFEDFLKPRWRAHGLTQGLRFPDRDWAENLAPRLLAAGRGRSLRQQERCIKLWTRLHTG